MFEGDDALKKIGVLSGGEKSRVLLGKLIATPLNLLLLDEPTNHLDIESNDALLSAVDGFDGAVVMVTHNERFLHALAERLIVFDNDDVFVYEGGYGRFLDKVGWAEEVVPGTPGGPGRRNGSGSRAKAGGKELRRLRSEIIADRSRVLRPLEARIADIEKAVESADASLKEINSGLVKASHDGDGSRVVDLSRAMHRTKKSLDALLEELETLEDRYRAEKAGFEARLRTLDAEDPADLP